MWPASIAAAGLIAATTWLTQADAAANHGRFYYPLDDTYIHMAVAKNLALHGTWGGTPDTFASSSSSPGWIVLLAGAFRVLGPIEWAPLALNLGLGLVLVAGTARWLVGAIPATSSPGRSTAARSGVLLAALTASALPAMVVLGMEHVLQTAVSTALLVAGARVCGDVATGSPMPALGKPRGPAGLLALAALAPVCRYEGLLLVAAIALLLALRGRAALATTVVLAACVPAGAYAAMAMARGWYPIPAGVLLASTPAWTGVSTLERVTANLQSPLGLLPLSVLGLLQAGAFGPGLLARGAGPEPAGARASVELPAAAQLYLLAFGAQALIGRVGDAWRYDAWWVWVGVVLVGVGAVSAPVRASSVRRAAMLALWALLGVAVGGRSGEVLAKVPAGAVDVRTFAAEPARLIVDTLGVDRVAITWLGYASWIADGRPSLRLLDLDGLASREAASLFLGPREEGALDRLVRSEGVQAAIVGDTWFRLQGYAGPPAGWVPVATWRVRGAYSGWLLTDRVWAASGDLADALVGRLRAALDRMDDAVILVLDEGTALEPAALDGPVVRREDARVALYSVGTVDYVMPAAGDLVVTLSADVPAGTTTRLEVTGRLGQVLEVGGRARRVDLGRVEAGEHVAFVYRDDLVDPDGFDRNVYIWSVQLVGA